MFRRQLQRQSRALRNPETLLPRTRPSSSFPLPQHNTPRYSLAFPPRIWQRHQSTEATKASTDPNSAASSENAQDASTAAETPAENPLQKDLDAKNKELIALKVRTCPPIDSFQKFSPNIRIPKPADISLANHRISICDPSPTTATSKTAQNVTWTPPANSPSNASPPTF